MINWIDIDDRMPDANTIIIVTGKEGFFGLAQVDRLPSKPEYTSLTNIDKYNSFKPTKWAYIDHPEKVNFSPNIINGEPEEVKIFARHLVAMGQFVKCAAALEKLLAAVSDINKDIATLEIEVATKALYQLKNKMQEPINGE